MTRAKGMNSVDLEFVSACLIETPSLFPVRHGLLRLSVVGT